MFMALTDPNTSSWAFFKGCTSRIPIALAGIGNIGLKPPVYLSELGVKDIQCRVSDKVNLSPCQIRAQIRTAQINCIVRCQRMVLALLLVMKRFMRAAYCAWEESRGG